MMNFCFFHVGADIDVPQMMVNSIRKFNPDAEIFYCTDRFSPAIQGVHRIEFDGNPNELMLFKVNSFANSSINGPAIYLDTDMLCCREIKFDDNLHYKDIYLCQRSFDTQNLFNGNFLGLDFMEYDKKPLGEVYPYLACATITVNSVVWKEIASLCDNLSQKFKIWYGDQEALKFFVHNTNSKVDFIQEHKWACLPEYSKYFTEINFMHFKGARKKLMKNFYDDLMVK